ncbi:twin-arginine translocation signal domain-containing protein [Salmonella enterica subsp. enterica serovar Typhimurium]|nr:twin-arginine translocation signal domain-containing protein [Salmonella enterica subsp. enterica serovar Typhimurium]
MSNETGHLNRRSFLKGIVALGAVAALCNDPAVPAQLSGFGIGLRRCFHL